MVKLESFGNISKQADDLLKKKYPFKNPFMLKLKTAEVSKFFLGSRALINPGKAPTLRANLKYTGIKDLIFESKLWTNGDLNLKVDSEAKFVKNTKLISEVNLKNQSVATAAIHVDYTYPERFKLKASVTDGPNFKWASNLKILDNLGLGLQTGYNFTKSDFNNLSLALWFAQKDYSLALKHEGAHLKVGKLTGSAFYGFKDLQTCARVSCDFADKNKLLGEFGAQYKLHDELSVRGKLSTAGTFSAGFDSRIAKFLRLTFAASVRYIIQTPFKVNKGPWDWGIIIQFVQQ